MTVNVDQLTTEVIPEPEPSRRRPAHQEPDVETLDRARARRRASTMMRDRARTAAEGFDD